MADERLRALERRAASGAPDDIIALRHEQQRLGLLKLGERQKVSLGRMPIKGVHDLADGRLLLEYEGGVPSQTGLRLLDLAAGEVLGSCGEPDARSSAVSPDLTLVAGATASRMTSLYGYAGAVAIWDIATRRERWRTQLGGFPTALAWAPDGARLLATCTDRRVRLLGADDGRVITEWDMNTRRDDGCVAWLDADRAVTAGGDRDVRVWDVGAGRLITALKGHEKLVEDLAVAPNGSVVVTASADATARVWDVAAKREAQRLTGHKKGVLCVAVSPLVRRALTGGRDGTIRLWDLPTGREVLKLEGHEGWVPTCAWVTAVAYAHDGVSALSGGIDGTVRVWTLPF